MIKILANDGIDPAGKALLEAAGFFVDTVNIPQEELPAKLGAYDAITVRSATKVRKALIDAVPSLKLIGRGGVGMDNIDVEYAKEKGVAVYNTPASSSLSVAELVFAHLFTGVRFLQDSNRKMPVEGASKFNDLKKSLRERSGAAWNYDRYLRLWPYRPRSSKGSHRFRYGCFSLRPVPVQPGS